jgi:hypothetical protein
MFTSIFALQCQQLTWHAHSRAAAPRKIAAAKVVAENWRSEEAALKVEVGLEALPDSELEVPAPVAVAEEPVLEPEPVAAAPLEEAAVTKPEAEAEALPEAAVEEEEVSAVERKSDQ